MAGESVCCHNSIVKQYRAAVKVIDRGVIIPRHPAKRCVQCSERESVQFVVGPVSPDPSASLGFCFGKSVFSVFKNSFRCFLRVKRCRPGTHGHRDMRAIHVQLESMNRHENVSACLESRPGFVASGSIETNGSGCARLRDGHFFGDGHRNTSDDHGRGQNSA